MMRYASVTDRLAGLGSDKWAVHFRARQMKQAGHEIIELTTHAPASGNPVGWSKNLTLSHANGKITAKAVKAF